MREIKFRAWDKEKKVMGDVNWLCPRDKEVFKINCWFGDEERGLVGNQFELMQYSGLLDSKGKEIYEGDIVKEQFNHGWCNCEIIYESAGFFISNGKEKIKDNLHWHYNGLEVIGNIYENENLLKNGI